MKLFSLLTAAAALLVATACASTPVPTDERVVLESAEGRTEVQPGFVYVSEEAARVFTLRDIESEINERGYLAVRVFGKTAELSALKWAFFGDIDYDFCYHFVWFDAEGNLVESDTADIPRSTIPGDPIRFVGHAPTEECRDFALILHMASQKSDAVASGDDDDEQADEAAEAEAKVEAEEVAEEAETLAGESCFSANSPQPRKRSFRSAVRGQ